MKKVEALSIKYIGFDSPETDDEINLELLGLETVIAQAYQRIAVLKQSVKLRDILKNSAGETNAQTIPKTP